jgi:hypothetical protein
MTFRCRLEFGFGSYRDRLADGLLEICIEPLIWVQFRRIPRQIEDFDPVLACLKPALNNFE